MNTKMNDDCTSDLGEGGKRPAGELVGGGQLVVPERKSVGRRSTVERFRTSDGVVRRADRRYRSWTGATFSERDVHVLEALEGLELFVCGRELAPSTGKEHFQFVFRLGGEGITFMQLRELLTDGHFEPTRDISRSVKYCRKDGNMVVDFGAGTVKASSSKEREDAVDDIFDIIDNATSYSSAYAEIKRKHRRFLFWNRKKVQEELMDKFPPPGGLPETIFSGYGNYGNGSS